MVMIIELVKIDTFSGTQQWFSSSMPFRYTLDAIRYYDRYSFNNPNDRKEHSSYITLNKEIIGVLLATVSKGELTSQGMPLLYPYIEPKSVADMDFAIVMKRVFNLLELEVKFAVSEIPMRCHFSFNPELTGANRRREVFQNALYVDLSQDLSYIWSGIRKSYKSLINRGTRELLIATYSSENITNEIWRDFRKLHFASAGRQTRSDQSWDAQFEMVKDNNAFLVTVQENGELLGCSLFTFNSFEAIYSVAAFDRTRGDLPLGHISQWQAIQELKERKICWYRIGEVSEEQEEDVKQLQINHFKKGFVTDIIPEYIVTTN